MPTSFRGFAHADACRFFDGLNPINVKVLSAIAEKFNWIRLRCGGPAVLQLRVREIQVPK
jgi:hypothetical protein